MKVINAPNFVDLNDKAKRVFLAGSIDNGAAENWQQYAIDQFESSDITILNPRRPDWDSTWECTKTNSNFVKQVEWELNGLENCDYILMYFAPNSIAPISLLELGIFHKFKGMVVVCPEGYHRKGNVDIVCDTYGILQLDTLDDAINYIKVQCITNN